MLILDGVIVTEANKATDGSLEAADINFTATDRLLGRSASGAGDGEEITLTSQGRALIDDATAAAQRTTMGLGTGAVQNLIYGITDPSKLSVSYDASTRQLTTVNTGTTVVLDDETLTPTSETTAAHADATGGYFFYYESGNTTLTVATSIWDILTTAPVAYVYYNTDQGTAKAVLFDERHSTKWEATHHYTEHFFHGTKRISGFALADYTLKDDTDVAMSIASGVIGDEDIVSTLTAIASAGPYTVFYRAGTDAADRWDWDATPTVPWLSGGTYAYYNQLNAGSWSLTELSNGQYVNYYIVAAPEYAGNGIFIVMGQQVHDTRGSAADEDISDIDWSDVVPFQEITGIAKVSLRIRDAYSSTGKARIENVLILTGAGGAALTGVTPDSHQALSDRDAEGAHPASAISVDAASFASGFLASTDDDAQAVADAIDTAASGADASIVTGTAGTSGNLASWNADGDAVDAGASHVASDTTIYVRTDGNTDPSWTQAVTDGASPSGCATIATALALLNSRWIAADATVTIDVADGTYTTTSAIEVTHPQGRNINIVGNTDSGTARDIVAQGGQMAAVDGTDHTIKVGTSDLTADYPAGSVVYVSDSTANDGYYYVKSVAWDSTNTVITLDGLQVPTPAEACDGSTQQVTDCPWSHKVKIDWSGGSSNGFTVATVLRLSGVALVGNASGFGIRCTYNERSVGAAYCSDVLASGWGRGYYVYGSGLIFATSLSPGANGGMVAADCIYGYYADTAGVIHAASQAAIGCTTYGTYANVGCTIKFSGGVYRTCDTDSTPAVNTVGNGNSYVSN